MNSIPLRLVQLCTLIFPLMLGAQAQVQNLTFAYKGPADQNLVAVGVGGLIPFPNTTAGGSTAMLLVITNKGTADVEFTAPSVNGNSFTAAPAALTIAAGQVGSFTLTFSPKVSGAATANLTIMTSTSSAYPFFLSGAGVAPNFVISYVLNPDGNQTPIGDHGTISFPQTQANQNRSATITISNTGTGAGTVSAATVTGAEFRMTGLPLLPAQVNPTNAITFTIVFSPKQSGSFQGTLTLTAGGNTSTITLAGQAASAEYSYSIVTPTATAPIAPAGTIQFGQVELNAGSAVTVQVQNTGSAPGIVNSVTVVGTKFAVTNLNPLPATLTPGSAIAFTLTFTPTAPGLQAAKLLIDGASFNLAGTGLGAQLAFNFVVGSSTTIVTDKGTANFPNTIVGQTVLGIVNIDNTGNVTGSVNSISVSGAYFGATIPGLPASIPAGSSLAIPISFVPNALGALTGALTMDNVTINLRGIGTAPSLLPAYSFTGLSDTAPASSQPSIGLTLASPYPTDITGTLTLSFTPDSFGSDPAIQFASGGATVPFVIPAETTTARFGTAAAVQFQTGTVSGVITITPAFATGQVSITPLPPSTKSLVIPQNAPVIRSIQLGAQTANSFEVLISGYSTPRSVTQIGLQFAGSAGANLGTTSLNIDADSAFRSWFQSTPSTVAGGQFTASVTVVVNGSAAAVQSVSATLTNNKGTSNSVSIPLR